MSAFRPDGWTTPELAQAVERGQLELHYQPVVDLRSGGIVGAEALLRWRHPTLGLLPPGQFLPVVESSGLMPEIGAWVLGEACRQMRDWRMLAWRPFRLAVNVSASQVGPDFDGWVKGVLADAELPAEYLEIELTESVAFGDPAIFPALDALRQIGVRFAADDFGTGYSCLQHLKCCPISTLKIDQSFVAGLANDRRDQTIVHTVIQLAHGLGMDVVAEGVETSASLDLLRQADCDTGQGFLFAKPMPAAAFAADGQTMVISGVDYTKWLWGNQRYDGSLYNFTTVPGEGFGDNGQGTEFEILVASTRGPMHIVEAAQLGADICTCPAKVIDALFKHPLTDIGLANFLKDWEKAQGALR